MAVGEGGGRKRKKKGKRASSDLLLQNGADPGRIQRKCRTFGRANAIGQYAQQRDPWISTNQDGNETQNTVRYAYPVYLAVNIFNFKIFCRPGKAFTSHRYEQSALCPKPCWNVAITRRKSTSHIFVSKSGASPLSNLFVARCSSPNLLQCFAIGLAGAAKRS